MAARTLVFMFSGQGSQYFRMGQELFERQACFREWMLRLDGLVAGQLERSVVEELYARPRSKGEPFERTLLTHPAIFMVEYALAQCLLAAGLRPDAVLGASLGSYAAAAVAGWLDCEAALTAVVRQAQALERHCEPGGMTAVLADPTLFEKPFLAGRSELAAVNFSGHFVVSAPRAALAEIEAELRRRALGFQPLPVTFAFHSRWIDPAREPFEQALGTPAYRPGRLPLARCDTATLHPQPTPDFMWEVVRRPIRFHDTVLQLERQGACSYVDVGPAGTLATFLKYALPAASKSTPHTILSPFGNNDKNLAAVLGLFGGPPGLHASS